MCMVCVGGWVDVYVEEVYRGEVMQGGGGEVVVCQK